jgi:hypothetical protein
MTITEFVQRFHSSTRTSGQWLVKCPAHRDDNASLALKEGTDGKILLHCHAGCSTTQILGAMGLRAADLFSDPPAPQKREVAVYDYADERGTVLYQVVRFEPKTFRQRRPDGAGGHIWNLKGIRRVLYRLPDLKDKPAVVIVEGEKDVDALWNLGIPATCNVAGAGKWRDDYTQQLLAAGAMRIRILPDNDGPGTDHARAVFESLSTAGTSRARELDLQIVTLPDIPEKGDVSDYLKDHTRNDLIAVLKSIPNAGTPAPTPSPSELLDSPTGAEVVDQLTGFVRRYMVLTDDQLTAFVLWVLHCHTFDAADTTPYLAVTSAGKQAGKTRLLEVAELLTPSPWLTGRASAAVLVRKIARLRPTLLLDETDAAFKQGSEYSEALRAILNTGFRRGGKASLCVKQGGDYVDKDFETFCPKAIAGIGALPDTVADRSIPLRIRRRLPSEPIERFRDRAKKRAAAPVVAQIGSWAKAQVGILRDAEPSLPEGLRDRAADVWEPLIAIADTIGGQWPERARAAALRLSGGREAQENSPALTLLADIQTVFTEMTPDESEILISNELVDHLKDLDGRPWGEYGRLGKGLTPAALAKLLKEFDVFPGDPKWVLIEGKRKQRRGYRRSAFEDAFARWLGSEPSQCNNVNENGPHSSAFTCNTAPTVTPVQPETSSIKTASCYGVTVEAGSSRKSTSAQPAWVVNAGDF